MMHGMPGQSEIYLDNNATTRPFPEVVETVAFHLQQHYANPGSRHSPGQAARKVLEDSRETIAAVLGAKPNEVIFTSGGTESTNIVLFGVTQGEPGTIVLTAGEHPATIESCRQLEKAGWKLHWLEVDGEGRLLPEQYTDLPWPEIKLVSIILAHNETGVIQDVAALTEQCRAHKVPIHIDAVQAVGKIPVNFHELGVSALSLGAHKFHGPRGIGALLLRENVQLAPIQFGGHQESGRRPGTESVALIAGMAKALEIWQADASERANRIAALRDRLEQGLLGTCAPVVINGSRQHRLPNTLNIAFPGLDGEALLVAFGLDGIACSLGSTCASGSAEPAPVLLAMQCPPEVCIASVRFSVGCEDTEDEIDEAVRRVSAIVSRQRQSTSATV
jgi:cysteine desulfurase